MVEADPELAEPFGGAGFAYWCNPMSVVLPIM
jgi:hypothetical protein